MKIIVVGCGKVGAALTAQLSQEGHDIAVIDVNNMRRRTFWSPRRILTSSISCAV